MSLPKRSEFEGLGGWVSAVADETDLPEETVWEIVEEFRPGASAVAADDAGEMFRRLLEEHTMYMRAYVDEYGHPDRNCKIQIFVEDSCVYEFRWPSHNIIDLEASQKEEVSQMLEDEEFTLQSEGDHYLTGFLEEGGVDNELRLITRVLQRLYGVPPGEADTVIEQRHTDQLSWTDDERIEANIEDLQDGTLPERMKHDDAGFATAPNSRSDGSENRTDHSGAGHSETVDSEQQSNEYDDWVFCQICGEQIDDPSENPRFCVDCRG